MTEYAASTENLVDEGRLDVVPSSHSYYMSLMPSVTSSQRSLATSYLNARPSTAPLTHNNRHGKGKRAHRKGSTSSESRQIEIVKHNFKKLQICFVVLCALNVIMLTVYVVMYPKFRPLFSDSSDDFTETGDGQLKTFKLCTKCQPLVAKVGFADGLIDNIRSVQYPKFCCFRRIDQILSLFDGYAEKYVDQEVFKVRQEMKLNFTRQLGMVTSRRNGSLAHLYYSELGDQSTGALSWETRGIDILLVGGMKILGQERLRIPFSGYYYIYSHLQFKPGEQVFHVVMKNEESKNKKKLLTRNSSPYDTAVVSELQGVFQLEEGDTLTVIATRHGIKSGERGNYFGVFQIEQ